MGSQHDSIASALAAIPADDRDTWVRMAFALKSELGDAGFDLWDEWSQANGGTYNARAARSTWKSAKAEGGVGIGSLYAVAKQHGWTGTAQRSPTQTRDQREARKAAEAVERGRLANEAAEAAQRAERMIQEATMDNHGYLTGKGFPEAQGLVLDGKLLIPMRDERTGELASIQSIDATGEKRFLRHGRASGAIYRMGRSVTVWHIEGYASALSLRAVLKRLYRSDEIRVCFSAANIPKVAARQGFVVADHDATGTGYKYAKRTGLPVWMPETAGWDINDAHRELGLDRIVDAIRAFIVLGRT